MTQHLRNGAEALRIRKRRADERQSYFESLSPEEQEDLKAENKAAYDYTHGGAGTVPDFQYVNDLANELR